MTSATIPDRILDCFPSGSYALTALLRLLDIVETEEIPTAAVECREQPRLRINPVFVARHAATPEKLLMLVMHELHHVLLGHTTLFRAATPVRNFVFDAVINGLICRMFPEPAYTSMLTDFYDQASYPECLLRPPPGWPGRPTPPKGIAALPQPRRDRVMALHRALYSDGGATYQEVFEALPRQLGAGIPDGIPLLGDHDPDGALGGRFEDRSPVLFDVVRGIVEQWPQPPDPIRGRSLADILADSVVARVRVPSARAVLRRLIDRIAAGGVPGRRRRMATDRFLTQSPIPAFDRRTTVLRALGHPPLLHDAAVPVRRRARSGERVHIYVDVSGSMDAVKGPLYGAVLDCRHDVHPSIHLFSTRVADVSLGELRRGVCRSTGGTDIACVAEHMERTRIRRALIITDGYVGQPRGAHLATLSRAMLAVAYYGTAVCDTDLAAVAACIATLPIGAVE